MSEWDEDIAELPLNEFEKNGLQSFRNYERSFHDHAEKVFSSEVDGEEYDNSDLEKVLSLLVCEDPRSIAIIACAYADERLELMYKANVTAELPGGKSRLFGPYGPISDFAKRIQIACAFDLISLDLGTDLDRLRQARNKISHSWDTEDLRQFYVEETVGKIFPIEELLSKEANWYPKDQNAADPIQQFRLRVIWMISRLKHETDLYVRAKQKQLVPIPLLYGKNRPKRLSEITKLAVAASKQVLGIA